MEIEQVHQINKSKWKGMCVVTVTLLVINIIKGLMKDLLGIFKVFTKFKRGNLKAKKNLTIVIHNINRIQMTCLVVVIKALTTTTSM